MTPLPAKDEETLREVVLMAMAIEIEYTNSMPDDPILYWTLCKELKKRQLIPRGSDVKVIRMLFQDMFRLVNDNHLVTFAMGLQASKPRRQITVMWAINMEELLREGKEIIRHSFYHSLISRLRWLHLMFAHRQKDRVNCVSFKKCRESNIVLDNVSFYP